MEHTREDGETREHFRKGDTGPVATLNAMLTDYKVPVLLVGSLLVAAGFGWRTPASAFQEIRTQVDTVSARHDRQDRELGERLDAVEGAQDDVRSVMTVLLRVECARSRSVVESQGVDCAALPRVTLPQLYRRP